MENQIELEEINKRTREFEMMISNNVEYTVHDINNWMICVQKKKLLNLTRQKLNCQQRNLQLQNTQLDLYQKLRREKRNSQTNNDQIMGLTEQITDILYQREKLDKDIKELESEEETTKNCTELVK